MSLSQAEIPLNVEQLRAFVEIVAIVAYADGVLDPKEARIISERAVEVAAGQIDDDWVRELLPRVRPPSPPPPNWRAERLAKLGNVLGTQESKRWAFEVSVEVAYVEGGIGRREATMLAAAAQELGLDAPTALGVLADVQRS